MAMNPPNIEKAAGDVEHRLHADEKSSDSEVADANEITWTEAEEKEVRNKVSGVNMYRFACLVILPCSKGEMKARS